MDMTPMTSTSSTAPLGYTIVGGLLLSQLLTLYTTPVVYLYLDRLGNLLRRNGATAQHECLRTTP